MSHRCPGPRCPALVPRNKLMCGAHWSQVPAQLAAAVYDTYRRAPGSVEHLEACAAAIEAIGGGPQC